MNISDPTYAIALAACGDLTNLSEGKKIHAHLSAKQLSSQFLQASLISMYSKCGEIDTAASIFKSSSSSTQNTRIMEFYDSCIWSPWYGF